MISKERVEELALEKIVELDYFLVDVKVSSTNEITVLFDNDNGVGIKECLFVSRHIEGNIDRDPLFTDPENGDYTLQEGSHCIDAGTIIEDMDDQPPPPPGAPPATATTPVLDSQGEISSLIIDMEEHIKSPI